MSAELAAVAYHDEPVRITHRQVTTQPSLVAKMVEALALAGDEKVLEVGTGGYQTALLAMPAREVWSIELWQDMTDDSLRRSAPCRNVAPSSRRTAGHGW